MYNIYTKYVYDDDASNSSFVADAATFLFKSELFMNPAMSDLSTNCFYFIFKSSF